MMGATKTPVGMPARARVAIASRRRSGDEVRGSMVRASDASRVVTETNTLAALCSASAANKSTSRVTR